MGAVHSPANDIARADTDAAVMELKRQDLTFDQIATELGISRATAHRAFHRALLNIPAPAVDSYRAKHLARLALMREVVQEIVETRHAVISNGHVVSPVIGTGDDGRPIYGEPYKDDSVTMAAVKTLKELDEREAKLLGLDAKTEVNLSGVVRYEIEGVTTEELT